MKVEIVLTPAEIDLLPGRDLSGSVCVVFDVLRATSTIVTALEHGAARVFPALNIDEAREWQRTSLPGALLGGERRGVRIDGFQLGNSPREYTREAVANRDIITTTTNGTVALRACASAGSLYAGALLNLRALGAHLLAHLPDHLVLVCAGSGRAFSLEDALGAGALLEIVAEPGAGRDAGDALRAIMARYRSDAAAALRESHNGRALTGIGLGLDVDWCAQVSCFDGLARAGVAEGRMCFQRIAP